MLYYVQVQKDDNIAKKFMVVILKPTGTGKSKSYQIVGIPLRGVDRETADKAVNPLRFAFEYGLHAQLEQIRMLSPRVAYVPDDSDELSP